MGTTATQNRATKYSSTRRNLTPLFGVASSTRTLFPPPFLLSPTTSPSPTYRSAGKIKSTVPPVPLVLALVALAYLFPGIAAQSSHTEAENAASHTYHEPYPLPLLILLSFLFLLPIAGHVAQRVLCAGLLGQILLGVIFGTPVGGWLDKTWEEAWVALGYVGLLGLVFEGGLTTSLPTLIPLLPVSLLIALTGIALPLGFSFLLIPLLGASPLHAFAAGSALASTSLGTTLAVLQPTSLGFDLRTTRLGTALLGAAVMDDIVAYIFAKVLTILGADSSSSGALGLGPQLGQTIGVTLGVGVLLPPLALYLLAPAWKWVSRPARRARIGVFAEAYLGGSTPAFVALVLLVWIGLIAAVTFGGTSALYGSYLAGLLLSYIGGLPREATHSATIDGGSPQDAMCLADSSTNPPQFEHSYPPSPTDSSLALVRATTLPTGGSKTPLEPYHAAPPIQSRWPRTFPHDPVGHAITRASSRAHVHFPPQAGLALSTHDKDPQGQEEAEDEISPFVHAFETYLAPVLFSLLAPLFFASIGYSIPFLSLWRGDIIWRGVVYALLMTLGKMVCGVWVVVWSSAMQRRHGSGSGSGLGSGSGADPESKDGAWLEGWQSGLVLGLGMVARGEIGLLIAQIAYNTPTPLLTEDEYLVVIWAILLCTIVGPVGLGAVIRRGGRDVVRGGWD